MQNYLIRNNDIKNYGCIDANKSNENMRILTLNLRGISPWNNHKMNMLIESCERE